MMMRPSARIVALGLSALLLSLAGVACGDDDSANPTGPGASELPGEPASVTLSAEAVHLAAIGAAYPLTATVSDSNGIALGDVAVAWTSGDESVATVDGSGRVEAVGVGETEITAEAGGASDAATVTVTQSAASVEIAPVLGELVAIGDSLRYTATVRDANGHRIENAAVAWSAADESVVTIDADGWVTSQANGRTTVEASVGDEVTDAAAVVVEQVVASVVITPAADTIAQDGTTQLAAEVTDANGVTIPGATVAWSSSRPGMAPVDGGGGVSSAYWGVDATITATVDGVSGTADVHVLDQMAFMTNRHGDYEIYMMNADGSDQRRLTYDGASELDPTWSPDGKRLAFASDRSGNYEIYAMNVDGSNVLNLTTDASTDFDPAWSPDGADILFRTFRDGNGEIYSMEVDGSNPVNLTNEAENDYDPAWSPDGTRIVFRSVRDGTQDLYAMEANGLSPTRLTNDVASDEKPAWSPDGTRIAFGSRADGDWEIYLMDPDGSNRVQLTADADANRDPSWSPDGSRFAFRSNRDGNFAIYVMDADGSNPVRITDVTSADFVPVWRPRP